MIEEYVTVHGYLILQNLYGGAKQFISLDDNYALQEVIFSLSSGIAY